MKQYKHVKLGRIAKYNQAPNPYYSMEDSNWYGDPKLIENSQDWELVKEDIFEKIYRDYSGHDTIEKTIESLKQSILKHMGITKEEIVSRVIVYGYQPMGVIERIEKLFSDRGLLLDN